MLQAKTENVNIPNILVWKPYYYEDLNSPIPRNTLIFVRHMLWHVTRLPRVYIMVSIISILLKN